MHSKAFGGELMKQEFVQRLQEMAADAVDGIHTAIPGTIESFDPSTAMAVVKPSMKYKKPDGSKIDYPSVSGVPVVFPQGNGMGAAIAYPVKPGDGCLLVVAEQSLDYWMYQMETDSELKFDLTNSIAIVGLFAAPGPGLQRACSENAVVITAGTTEIAVSQGGVDITGNVTITGDVTVSGNVHTGDATVSGIIAASGDITAGTISLENHTHTGVNGETSKAN